MAKRRFYARASNGYEQVSSPGGLHGETGSFHQPNAREQFENGYSPGEGNVRNGESDPEGSHAHGNCPRRCAAGLEKFVLRPESGQRGLQQSEGVGTSICERLSKNV